MPKCASRSFFKISVLFSLYLLPGLPLFAEKPIVVLTTSYNNRGCAQKNLDSILKQDYSNFRVLYIDDASTDGTADIVETIVQRHPKRVNFTLIRNPTRMGALSNIYHAIHEKCQDEEVIVSLDGDDWFYNDQVLKKIDSVYSSTGVWLTHGTMMESPGNRLGWSLAIPQEIIEKNAFRKFRCPSHLRTFYAWLFKKIRTEDLQYEGEFFKMTWDQAMMFPMIEMAGRRHAFIPEITYVYNVANPINDNKVDPALQNDLEKLIRSKPPYERLRADNTGINLCKVDNRNVKAVNYVGVKPTGGKVQLQLLQMEGLQKQDYVLEIGSGALVSSLPIMSFLEKEHYVGVEPNRWLIDQTLSIPENRIVVEDFEPKFLQNANFDGREAEIVFDYVFAHSVMTHAAHWQLPLFLENVAAVLKEGGKVLFSIRLTQPNEYGNEGAAKETRAEQWQYPGCSFFDVETVMREAKKWFRKIEYKKEYTAILTSDDRGACHDWFVLTK